MYILLGALIGGILALAGVKTETILIVSGTVVVLGLFVQGALALRYSVSTQYKLEKRIQQVTR